MIPLTALIVGMVVYFLLATALTFLIRAYSLKFNVIDIPADRSSHTTPTPRGGGAAIVITLTLLIVVAGFLGHIQWHEACALIIPGGLVATIGFIDDHKSLRSHQRLLVHFGSSSLAVILLPELPTITFGEFTLSSPLILYPTVILCLTWLLNLYNFMDGIDGIAGSETISVLLAATIILYTTGDNYWWPILLWCCAPVAGFLAWNWQPARIFMGDVGSTFLGITIGVLALLTITNSQLTPWTWIILLATFITDATWTLLTRIITGQIWHQAHRSHAYQVFARVRNSHALVSTGVAVINMAWLLPLAWLSIAYPGNSWTFAAIAYTPLVCLCWLLGAGLPEERQNQSILR